MRCSSLLHDESLTLMLSMTGRTGLGVPQPKRFLPYLSAPSSSSAAATYAQDAHYASLPLPDLEGYLSRLRSTMDDRRAFGLLRSARRTCEELDRRAGIEDSPMWRDPEEVERDEERKNRRRLFERVDKEVESDEEDVKKAESLFGAKVEDEVPRGKKGRGDLAYETGVSATVVETEDEEAESAARQQVPAGERTVQDVEEEAEWFSYDVRALSVYPSLCSLTRGRAGPHPPRPHAHLPPQQVQVRHPRSFTYAPRTDPTVCAQLLPLVRLPVRRPSRPRGKLSGRSGGGPLGPCLIVSLNG